MIRYWGSGYKKERSEILEAVDRAFSSGRLILGRQVQRFEEKFSSYCGTAFGIGVNSGTDALFLALKALGIGNGDEVITVSNTAVPTVAAIRAAGAMPVFVDVEEDTFLMNADEIESVISEKTKCVLPVHLFGQPADMERILDIASKNNLYIVEDCAQSAGATYKGKRAGSFGDMGAFSFYPTKILGAYGDGGMIVTGDETLYEKLRRLRFYGMRGEYYAEEEGYNSRLDEVQAAILNYKLKSADKSVIRRQHTASIYTDGLCSTGDIELPVTRKGRSHQFYAYTIKTDYRDRLMHYLHKKKIETRINYPSPVHAMKGYEFLGYKAGALPVTERLAARILSLPIYPGLSEKEALSVVLSIKSFFKQASERDRI